MTLMYVELKFYFIFISSLNGQRTKRPIFCCRSAAKLLDASAFIDSEKLFYFGQGLTIFMVNETFLRLDFQIWLILIWQGLYVNFIVWLEQPSLT